MSFAEKILKKYGWNEGEGLGKNNDGIAKPLKASLKFDNAGLGVDKAEEFNNHWWERVFNEAASNVQINKDGEKVSLNIKNEDSVEITTKLYSVRKLKKKNRDSTNYQNFLLSATVTKTGDEVSNPDKVNVEEIKIAKHRPLTDEELFAACGGRTAHKGARHGLKLSGKLARIEQQEKEFLLKMHSKVSEEPSQSWTVVKSKKKKNKEQTIKVSEEESTEGDESKLNEILYTAEYCIKSKKKRKEKKRTEEELSEILGSFSIENKKEDTDLLGISCNSKAIKKVKKSKKSKRTENSENLKTQEENHEMEAIEKEGEIVDIQIDNETEDPEFKIKKRKSKKCKHGIDKEAKKIFKKFKKLQKAVKLVTDLERDVLLTVPNEDV